MLIACTHNIVLRIALMSAICLPKTQNPSPILRKTSKTPMLRDILPKAKVAQDTVIKLNTILWKGS